MTRCHFAILVFLALILTACSSDVIAGHGDSSPTSAPTLTPAPSQTPTLTPTSTPIPTPTPAPLRVSVALGVPGAVGAAAQQTVQSRPDQFALVNLDQEADLQLIMTQVGQVAPQDMVATWVYALVAPFPTLVDDVPFAEIQGAWQGAPSATFGGSLRMSEETFRAFWAVWGEPVQGAVEVVDAAALADTLWNARPAWGIVPFEQLTPRFKVLSVDGRTPLHRNLDLAAYPLALAVGLNGDAQAREKWRAAQPAALLNRDESRMTLLAMTGVTALTRTTAVKMERNGVLYPAEKIRDWLTSADVVHISNEVSFWPDCPPPQVFGMEFCSAPKYVQIITDVHTSIVELTGNHLNDYGWEPLSYTLGVYNQLGLPYYGGGRTITESQRAVTLTHNGNLLGFVGCNPVGPPIDWVNGMNDNRPGSAPCNDAVLQAELGKLRAAGALPIATLQYWEFYHYTPTFQQVVDFRELVDWGAVIASGSQGHHPQGFELYNGGVIHYGVGNLFFGDQVDPNTRKTFVDRYLVYENRLLSVELLTAQIEDYSQPRPMTLEERRAFLQTVFAASGW